jgi:RNA polymerase sigma factor (sigma-70 family)
MGRVGGGLTDGDAVVASWRDPSAFAILFDRHARVVHRFIAARASRNDVEDLVAETFTTAFRSRSRFDRRHDDARPWLLGIAANVLRHHYRAEARHQRRRWSIRLEVPPGNDPAEEAISQVEATSSWEDVARALDQLHDRYREVLLLVAAAELTYEETARALDVPVGTVRSRLARGRQQLRELLGPDWQYLDAAPAPATTLDEGGPR